MKDGDLLQVGNVELLFENKESKGQSPVKTMTVINLDDTGTMDITSTGLKNIGTKVGKTKGGTIRENRKHNMIFIIIIALLSIGVIAGIVYLLLMILSNQS